jgi:E3 ubiquitin-protein ligase UBR4
VALLEDDTGMELLVCNKIISLDLPVKEVYKKIWCAQDNHNDRMKVVYRMRGLLGDATEDMIETLNDNKDEDIDEEEVFKMAAVLGQCNRLDAILLRLSHARHFMRSHGMIKAGLKLLGYCVKVKTNRQYLIQSHLNTLKILLNILNMALEHEQIESSGIGATVAQQVLSVTEPILQESSIQQRVIVRSMSDELTVVESSEEHTTLQMLLKHIESPFVQSNLGVREGLMHIIPFLTFGDPLNMTVLLQHFAPYLDFERFDNEKTPEHSLYLDCFSVVATGIGTDASGEKLKDLLIEMKLTPSSIDYIINRTPSRGSGRFDTPEWEVYLSSPSLPYVLKILTGLCQHHAKTQLMVSESIPQVHLLEQVSSTENSIGTLAEKLLEALRANPECDQKIQDVRKATRAEKKRKAMEMRAKELGALGFQMNEKGQVVAETPTAFKEIESEVVEETGLQCCICLEGYRNQPQKVLGVYTFTRKVVLDEFENKPRKTVGYGTVSHFNVVHFDCHSSAVKLARGRNEWESATLQNANTRCNGLLPIWGPEVSDSVFANALARHNSYLQEYTGLYDPSFRSYSHDLRLLLLRFAHETSFSAESGGGGPQSNLHLIPYLIHVVLYVIDTTRVYQREERNLNNFLILTRDKWISSAYEVENSLHYAVITIFLLSLPQWEENKVTVLSQLLVLSHARKASSSPIKSLPTNEVGAYADYKPVLIFFGLIDAFHRLLKVTYYKS